RLFRPESPVAAVGHPVRRGRRRRPSLRRRLDAVHDREPLVLLADHAARRRGGPDRRLRHAKARPGTGRSNRLCGGEGMRTYSLLLAISMLPIGGAFGADDKPAAESALAALGRFPGEWLVDGKWSDGNRLQAR